MRSPTTAAVVLLSAILAGPAIPTTLDAESTPTLLWERTFNNPSNDGDAIYDAALDPSGNLLIGGMIHAWTASSDFRCAKYDTNGDTLWVDSYDSGGSDEVNSICSDSSGNAVIVGPANCSWMVRKLSSTGSFLWATTFSGAGCQGGHGIAADPLTGDIAVAGSLVVGSFNDMAVRKYSANGDLLWSRTLNGPVNSHDEGMDTAVDGSGNVIVAAYLTDGSGNQCWLVIKYDPAGNLVWSRTAGSPSSASPDGPRRVVVDAAGNIIVAGNFYQTASAFDWAIQKYDSNGNLLWTRTRNGAAAAGTDRAHNVTTDAIGNVFVTGYQQNTSGGRGWLTIKYGPNGDIRWTMTDNGTSPASQNEPTGIALDASGNLFIAGYFVKSGQGANWTIRKYAPPPTSSAWLAASISLSSTCPTAGQTFTLRLTVTNTGNATCDATSALLGFPTGGGLATPVSGPSPAGANINPGAAQTFFWTYLAATAGAVTITGEASGTCAGTGQGRNAAAGPVALDIHPVPPTPGALACQVGTAPDGATCGKELVVTLTISNTGGSTVSGIVPWMELGTSATLVPSSCGSKPADSAPDKRYVSGPTPGGSLTLSPGSGMAVIWTYQNLDWAGTAPALTGSATGTDALTSARVTACGQARNPFRPPTSSLSCAVTVSPSTVDVGQRMTVTVRITNSGNSDMGGIAPSLEATTGAALVSRAGAPGSAPLTIAAGTSRDWSWTYDAKAGGTVTFSSSASGVNACADGARTTCSASGRIESMKEGTVKVVGGLRGYINPKKGERANVIVRPTGSGEVVLRIYDMKGTLVRETKETATGNSSLVLQWDARDANGSHVSPGAYPITITGPGIKFKDTLAVLR